MSVSQDYQSVQALLNSPWRITNELRRQMLVPIARLHFAMNGIKWGQHWRILGLPIIQRHRLSSITIGDYVELRSWYASNPLVPNHPVTLSTRTPNALISIGENCGFTGAIIVAAEKISIGNRVILGANATVVDTDFHPISAEKRQIDTLDAEHSPVMIEDDVFVGMNALILKGVLIGQASVVGAGSVVVKDVPRRTLVAGNPARVIRELD